MNVLGEPSKPLPEYEKPPLIEVVCGLQFRPIEKLLAPFLGLLWERFKPEYSTCQEVNPLIPTIERFEEPPKGVEFQLTEVPPMPRIWFVTGDDKGIVQVQRDRFLHNWRKVRPHDEYPRYETIIKRFRGYFDRFRTFVAEFDLGSVLPTQCELTYVNHIPEGEGWDSLGNIAKLLPDFSWEGARERFVPVPEEVNWRNSFLLPDRLGRLHAHIRSARRKDDNKRIVSFELTARGIGKEPADEVVWSWFETAHEWIVRAFTDMTSTTAQKDQWKRIR